MSITVPQRASSERGSADRPRRSFGGLEEDAFSFGTGLSDMPDVVLPTSPPALAPEVKLLVDSTKEM